MGSLIIPSIYSLPTVSLCWSIRAYRYGLVLTSCPGLACVAGGLAVAFSWTFFPYPTTTRSQLRRELGRSLFLLANFYSCVHTTVRVRLRGIEGDMDVKTSPGRRLEKYRNKIKGALGPGWSTSTLLFRGMGNNHWRQISEDAVRFHYSRSSEACYILPIPYLSF